MISSMRRRVGIGVTLFVSALLIGLATIYLAPTSKTVPFTADGYVYGLSYAKELTGVPVIAQQTPYTCNVVSMAIVQNYFGTDADELSIRVELGILNRTSGMLPDDYVKFANQTFNPLGISMSRQNPTSQTDILNIISTSLADNLPVVIFYSTVNEWDPPNYDTHYAVIYGIDMATSQVKISNPYGHLETMSFTQLFAALDFSNYHHQPFAFRLASTAGLVKPNNLFVFAPLAA